MIMVSPATETPVEVETGPDPTASIIWLHGLGADGHDFEGIVPELSLPASPAVRFIFPHAPYRPVTINGGYVMRAWYDLALSNTGLVQNAEDIRASIEIVHSLIDREETRGIDSRRLVLAGFSQGGTVALHAGLPHPRRLAGIMALSAPVTFVEQLVSEWSAANRDTSVFMAHGTLDPVVPFDLGRQACGFLRAHGVNVEWHEYRMEHTLLAEELGDIARWLTGVLAMDDPSG